jgi:hypothetical protein
VTACAEDDRANKARQVFPACINQQYKGRKDRGAESNEGVEQKILANDTIMMIYFYKVIHVHR